MSLLAAADLLIRLGREVGPCIGYDLDISAVDGGFPVPLSASALVEDRLQGLFVSGGERVQKLDLYVQPRADGERLVLIRSLYLLTSTPPGSSAAVALEAILQGSDQLRYHRFRAAEARLLGGDSILLAPLLDPVLVPIPGMLLPDTGHLIPSYLGTGREIGEIAIATVLRAAIALPAAYRQTAEPGLLAALGALIGQVRLGDQAPGLGQKG